MPETKLRDTSGKLQWGMKPVRDSFGGFIDPNKKGKFKSISSRKKKQKTWVKYSRTFILKYQALEFRNYCKYNLGANNVRVFDTKSGFEVWVND